MQMSLGTGEVTVIPESVLSARAAVPAPRTSNAVSAQQHPRYLFLVFASINGANPDFSPMG
jgi:hypothetical protein